MEGNNKQNQPNHKSYNDDQFNQDENAQSLLNNNTSEAFNNNLSNKNL